MQEPEDGKGAAEACALNFGTSFPMFDKVSVNGPKTIPLFSYLKKASGNGLVKWNYTKFLVYWQGLQVRLKINIFPVLSMNIKKGM